MSIADPSFMKSDLRRYVETYREIADCIEGEKAVKLRRAIYLPVPNAADKSAENLARYNNYLSRAVFYNVTRRTLDALVGMVFSRDPSVTVPTSMSALLLDADGGGVSLTQVAKIVLSSVVSYGRAGIFVDFPTVGTEYSKQDVINGILRPTINFYTPQNIINWRETRKGGKKVVSLIVLRETYTDEVGLFEEETRTQYRVLLLDDAGRYRVDLWREGIGSTVGNWSIYETYVPTDNQMRPLDFIPFRCVGAENNDFSVDLPPLQDLASLNLAHYRNSADYEDNVFHMGQLTPWISGLTQPWVDNNMKGTLYLGAPGVIPLPENANIGILQASPNIVVGEAMKHKEDQMKALGAKLIEPKVGNRTATEVSAEQTSDGSILASCAKNVSTALREALEFCALFTGDDASEIEFELSSDFDLMHMTAEERKQLLAEYVGGGITFTEYRHALRRAGIASMDDVDAQKEIDASAVRAAEIPVEVAASAETE